MPAVNPPKRLDQLRVVVTRPAHQAEPLCQMIEQAGGTAIRLPVIEIAPPSDIQSAQEKLGRLKDFSIVIFTSANAVDGLFKLAPASFSWPQKIQVAAIGKRTSSALRAHSISVDIVPEQGFNSESLLKHPVMNAVSGKKIMLFKGEGGRELLAQALIQRGATVEGVDLYRRKRPNEGLRNIQRAGKSGSIDLFIVTSNEGLRNLLEMATETEQKWLLRTELVVISERTAQFAKTLGFSQQPVVANEASDEGLLNSIEQWYADRFRRGIQRGE